jgi:DNA-directed RNA polymerase specialized sigma24 family protein
LDAEFTEFHNAVFRPLANYSDRLSRGRASGDDVAQDTLMQMYRLWPWLPKDPVQLRNRAFGIAHDRTVSIIRRSVKLDEILRVLKAGAAAFVDPDLGGRIEVEQTLAAIDLLPQKHRAVLLLTIAGVSAEEIAMALNLKRRSVDTYLSKARETLTKIVGNSARRQRSRARYPGVRSNVASERRTS